MEQEVLGGTQIRTVTESDASRLLEIYSYYVERTAVSFEYETPSLDEFKRRIRKTLERYPYLCIISEGEIMGYAYAGPFVGRAAYGWSAEMTIYLAPEAGKRGFGRKLYEELEDALKKMGILNLYACIGYPETEDEYLTKNSAQFHEHMGYRMAGKFQMCGYKFGRWYDMVWMEKIIGRHETIEKGK